jgi:TRAP transporter TAXI family solute receptor
VEFRRQTEVLVSGAPARRPLCFFSAKTKQLRAARARIFMLGFNRWHLSFVLAAILGGAAIVWLALEVLIPAPPKKITIATGQRNQIYQAIGNSYRAILARSGVDVDVRLTNGAVENLALLNDPHSGVTAGIVQGGISDGTQSPDVRSLGRINYQVYWLFYSAAETITDLRQLKGKRIALGPEGSGQRPLTEKILEISGVTDENTTLVGLSAQESVNAINDGTIDAMFLPFALDSPILRSLLASPRVRPMSFTEAEALTRIFPYLVRLVLPRGVVDFERIVPSTDMILIAASNVVLVRKDIHPAIIDLLARAIMETHGKPGPFQQAGEFPKPNDPEYPVSETALDFYKNGPTFLNRYLPWMTNYARRMIAVVAAVIAIVLPLFSYAPKGYKWLVNERLNAMYRRLRRIEARLQNDMTAADVAALEADLDGVDRAIHRLAVPMRYSDVYFSVKSHLDLVRTRIGSRRAEMVAR